MPSMSSVFLFHVFQSFVTISIRSAHFCLFLDVIYLLSSCELLFAYYSKIFIYLFDCVGS